MQNRNPTHPPLPSWNAGRVGVRFLLPTWAAREVLRSPGPSAVLFCALFFFVALTGSPLLLSQALSETACRALQHSPALTIQRFSAGRWHPMPKAPALTAAAAVPGVVRIVPRIWGVVQSPVGPVTVWGTADPMDDLPALRPPLEKIPAPGQAVAGWGTAPPEASDLLLQNGPRQLQSKLIARFPQNTSPMTHDLVWLHPDDARHLLDLAPGFVSDLALDVFHDAEAKAMIPDLIAAFPWPVRVTVRNDLQALYTSAIQRRGGICLVTFLPALLALVLLTFATLRNFSGRRYEVAVYKAVGWCTGDIVRLQLLRAGIVGLPAVTAGVAAAYGAVFGSDGTWIGRWLLGWENIPPVLHLSPAGAIEILSITAAVAVLPYLLATLWAAAKAAACDPLDLLQEEAF